MKCDEYRITAPALRHGHFSVGPLVGPPWWDGRRSSVGRPCALREIMDFRSLRWQFPILRRAFVPWAHLGDVDTELEKTEKKDRINGSCVYISSYDFICIYIL